MHPSMTTESQCNAMTSPDHDARERATVSQPDVVAPPAIPKTPPFYTIPRPPIPGVTSWRIVPW